MTSLAKLYHNQSVLHPRWNLHDLQSLRWNAEMFCIFFRKALLLLFQNFCMSSWKATKNAELILQEYQNRDKARAEEANLEVFLSVGNTPWADTLGPFCQGQMVLVPWTPSEGYFVRTNRTDLNIFWYWRSLRDFEQYFKGLCNLIGFVICKNIILLLNVQDCCGKVQIKLMCFNRILCILSRILWIFKLWVLKQNLLSLSLPLISDPDGSWWYHSPLWPFF